MPLFPAFIGPAYTSQSPIADAEALVNWYVEALDREAPSAAAPVVLYPTPGFSAFATLPGGNARGLFSQNDRTFAVGGAALYELGADGTLTERPMTVLATPAAPTVTQNPPIAAVGQPLPPTVAQMPGATAGTTTYGYKLTATNLLGETEASLEGTIATGAAELSMSQGNVITWSPATNAAGWKLYRTTGGASPPRLIFETTDPTVRTYTDTGALGTAVTPPVTNTTGTPATTAGYQGYAVVARLGLWETAASPATTGVKYTTPSAALYNEITWTAVPNARAYAVYRITNPGASDPTTNVNTLIGVISSPTLTLRDTGQTGTLTTLPTVNTTGSTGIVDDGAPVSWTSSGDAGLELLILSAGKCYCLNLETNVLALVLDGATFGGYLDGYFVALDAGSSTLKVSGRLDGFTWDASQVAQRTTGGDRWLAMAVHNQQIWLLGSQTSEVWYDAGTAPFPFAPVPSVSIPCGILAPFSLARVGNALQWLGQDEQGAGIVYRAQSYDPTRISTHALEYALSRYTTRVDAQAWSYQDQGHTFYVLTFPADGQTWVYDVATGLWAERATWNSDTGAFEAYRPVCHTYAFAGLNAGQHLVGDRTSGLIARMAIDLGLDLDGSPIRRLRRAPHLAGERTETVFRRLELVFETGLGLASGHGSDPTVMLRMSRDGGKTYGTERWRSAGQQGEYRTRVEWHALGSARDAVFELHVSDPIPWRLVTALLEADGAAA